jgi:cation diffusion facilitator CzcD-associated flavoprotein CzcO
VDHDLVRTGPGTTDPGTTDPVLIDAVVVGAGQAGLSSSWYLRHHGVEHVLLDAGRTPGGAWAHRWPTLTMRTVNGVHDLPGQPLAADDPDARASDVVSAYFADYERRWQLPVLRPVTVRAVRRGEGDLADRLLVQTGDRAWAARHLLNATGTWTHPFWPRLPGAAAFTGRQLHTADYRGPEQFTGASVVVVGGGISAVQLLIEVADVATTTWVTRRPPVFRDTEFDTDARREAVAQVEERVRAGLPPGSVISVTGLPRTPATRAAAARGLLQRYPVMDRIVADGVAWDDPVGPGGQRHLAADVLLWCTGFRAALSHLAPLHLREPGGGIRVEGSRAVREPRVHLVGYGPSASTTGATRAARQAVAEVRADLAGLRAP